MKSNRVVNYSIVIETDNLSAVDVNELRVCLDTLDRQGDVLRNADGVFIADGGMAPECLLQELQSRYSWLSILRADEGASYIELKLAGALQTKSEIIVFCDGDVQYEEGWLSALLDGFRQHPDADLIGGETTTPINGPYSLAFALTFNFPRLTGETELVASSTYWANNVAARRSTFELVPLPDPTEVFRGQNLIHANRIVAKSGVILRQPLARAWHAVIRPSEMIPRYYKLGRDAAAIRFITSSESGCPYLGAMSPDLPNTSIYGRLTGRFRQIVKSQPLALLWLPLAFPFLVMMGAAYISGWLLAGRGFQKQALHA